MYIMNLNKKLIFALTISTLASPLAFAANETFQASVTGYAEPTITEGTPLNFGKILTVIGSVCTMDNAGGITGQCDASAAHAAGTVTIAALAPSTAMNITVTGGSSAGSELTYVPITDVTDGTTNLSTADGVALPFTTTGLGADIAMTVYGAMTVDTTLTNGTSYTVDYTVDVSFQ